MLYTESLTVRLLMAEHRLQRLGNILGGINISFALPDPLDED